MLNLYEYITHIYIYTHTREGNLAIYFPFYRGNIVIIKPDDHLIIKIFIVLFSLREPHFK